MNAAKQENKLPFRLYALHRGGEHERAHKIIDSTDVNGRPWQIDFVWSTPEFEKQLGGVKGLPSYYVLDEQGRIRAVIKGHAKDTLGTLSWLIGEIRRQDEGGRG